MLEGVRDWTEGEVLGLDFETTGVDRFTDVPVSYALVSVVDGVAVHSWSGLMDPGREIPSDATAVHGITSERARAEGMPLDVAVALVSDAVVGAGRRGVPVVGMKIDYDLTILDVLGDRFWGRGLSSGVGAGPCSTRGCSIVISTSSAGVDGRSVTSARITGWSSKVPTTRGLTPWPLSGCCSRSRHATRRSGMPTWHGCTRHRSSGTGSGRRTVRRGGWARACRRPTRGTSYGQSRRPPCRPRREGARSAAQAHHFLSRSQTMSTPSFSARTTLAGCCLSMCPTSPL